MKQLHVVSRYKTLLGMRWLIVRAEQKNIDILESVKEKKCPVCGKRFTNIFLLQRHIDNTECGAYLEKALRE